MKSHRQSVFGVVMLLEIHPQIIREIHPQMIMQIPGTAGEADEAMLAVVEYPPEREAYFLFESSH